MSFLRSLVNSSGSIWILVAKLPMRALSAGSRRLTNSSAPAETSLKLSFMLPLRSSITTTVMGCVLGGKEGERLELAVVVNLEVVFGQVWYQPAGRVGHRGEDRDGARAALEWGLLLAGYRPHTARQAAHSVGNT